MKLKCENIDPMPGNDVSPPLELGKEYPLIQIVKDSKGNEHYDVGLVSRYKYITSHETKEELPLGDQIHWCHPSRFTKI